MIKKKKEKKKKKKERKEEKISEKRNLRKYLPSIYIKNPVGYTLVSDKFPIIRGVRRLNPISPELLTAVMEEIFKEVGTSEA